MSVWQYIRFLLAPLALVYFAIIWLRNRLYQWKIFRSTEFDFPVISVGNLSVGGTGKTPHVEYLIKLLANHYSLATLSRGYRRKTSGYILASPQHHAEHLGDEPALIKKKYPQIAVAVAEDRVLAMPQLLTEAPATQVVLLDDAFQHRTVVPGLSILLTTFQKPFYNDYILPLGSLREYRSAYRRADFIVVTKCPLDLTNEQRQEFIENIKPQKGQHVVFSYLEYDSPYYILDGRQRLNWTAEQDVYLFTGIASSGVIEAYVKPKVNRLFTKHYSDHHYFDKFDIEHITDAFNNIESQNKILLTTEKDVTRLFVHSERIVKRKLPIFVLPVKVAFFEQDKVFFDGEIMQYLQSVIK